MGDALNYQRYFLYSQIRVSVANAASSNATVANGLFPLQKVETLGTWVMIHQALHEQIRCDIGKAPSPTVAIIDSQSVKTTELANREGLCA